MYAYSLNANKFGGCISLLLLLLLDALYSQQQHHNLTTKHRALINMVDYNISTELLKSSGTLRLPWRRYKLLRPISICQAE